jgi:hypothetical protein
MSPEAPANSNDLAQLTDHLNRLADELRQASSRVTTYLARRDTAGAASAPAIDLDKLVQTLTEKLERLPAAASAPVSAASPAAGVETLSAQLRPLIERLDRLEAQLRSPADTASLNQSLDALGHQDRLITASLRELQAQIDSGFQEMARLLCPPDPAAEEAPAAGMADLERAILGPDMQGNPALNVYRQQLMHGVLSGEPAACGLAGQLLVFQSATAERLPQLLKEIGEAFYRWMPRSQPGTSPMEQSLILWLQKRCETVGIANTIEPVHPGERFDASRHNATSRGVEITRVHGWIVLRDNGKVYMKATVDVR